jgi:hypothetical protein
MIALTYNFCDDGTTLVTVDWVCKRVDGSVIWDNWDSYHLIQVDGEWKILDDTVYD